VRCIDTASQTPVIPSVVVVHPRSYFSDLSAVASDTTATTRASSACSPRATSTDPAGCVVRDAAMTDWRLQMPLAFAPVSAGLDRVGRRRVHMPRDEYYWLVSVAVV